MATPAVANQKNKMFHKNEMSVFFFFGERRPTEESGWENSEAQGTAGKAEKIITRATTTGAAGKKGKLNGKSHTNMG